MIFSQRWSLTQDGLYIKVGFSGVLNHIGVIFPVPDKALLDDDFQIFGRTETEFLFTDIEYYPSFKYYTSEFAIHDWLSALAVATIFAQFWIVLLVPNRS